jgi:predicted MPP superfamily phosphohydrolase
MRKIYWVLITAIVIAASFTYAQTVQLPTSKDSVKFAVIGDNGTGGSAEYQIAKLLAAAHDKFPFDFVVMMGDNLYGGQSPKDFTSKFEKPFKPLLDEGVKFYAALGNHDDAGRQISYEKFNMGGKRYYSFKPKNGVRFFALDSNYMDKKQLDWLELELKNSASEWKVLYFHHPIYSSGEKHGSNLELRNVLEPVLIKYGADLVLTGHEHFYERVKPQKGIHYFIVGSSGKLREGNIAVKSDLTAKGFDEDNTFMLAEISGDNMFFQVTSRSGKIVDSGSFKRAEKTAKVSAAR